MILLFISLSKSLCNQVFVIVVAGDLGNKDFNAKVRTSLCLLLHFVYTNIEISCCLWSLFLVKANEQKPGWIHLISTISHREQEKKLRCSIISVWIIAEIGFSYLKVWGFFSKYTPWKLETEILCISFRTCSPASKKYTLKFTHSRVSVICWGLSSHETAVLRH